MRPGVRISFLVAISGSVLSTGCRQLPNQGQAQASRADGADGTFEPDSKDDSVPIEKELAAPKGFFSSKREPFGGWSSKAREVEQSLGVNR